MDDKERHAIERMLMYCERAEKARRKHFPTREAFDEDRFYGDGIALYIQQIGKSVNDLSDEFIDANAGIPWHQIRGMRNIIAHAYEGVDPDIVWDVLDGDLPTLAHECRVILGII